MKKFLLVTSLVFAAFLSGCLVPEHFSATVDVHPDASYTFKYSGTVVNALAAAQIKESGALSEKDEKNLQDEVEKLSKDPDIQQVTYQGDGRYELAIESKKKPGEALDMLDIFFVKTDADGVLTITSSEIKEKGMKELEALGMTIDGTLEVQLPENAEIISHNATSSPSFFGMLGAYSWQIGSIDQRPMMQIKFK